MDANFKIGYARVNINPQLGIPFAGCFKPYVAKGVLDDIEAVAVAIESDGKRAVIISVDNCGIPKEIMTPMREAISASEGIPTEAIFVHSTHIHTGPKLLPDTGLDIVEDYGVFLKYKLITVTRLAFADLKPARMGIGTGEAKNVAFIRRYRMKDGRAMTNPGVNNPDIVAPIGTTDERVHVIRFERECDVDVVIANFANHPDVVGGEYVSSDWPGMTRRFTEQILDGAKCILLNGAQGDVNHVNVHPEAGDFNDMFHDFDGCSRGYGHARHIARVVTAAIMSVYDKVEWLEDCKLQYMQRFVDINSNKPDPSEIPEASYIYDMWKSGRVDELPYEGMMKTTMVANAFRVMKLKDAPETFPMLFSVITIGSVALFGLPGEPFTGIGRGLKEAEGWRMVIPCCQTNAKEGYFPMKDSYDEGGYEAVSSNFKAGTAERIIEEGLKILSELKA